LLRFRQPSGQNPRHVGLSRFFERQIYRCYFNIGSSE